MLCVVDRWRNLFSQGAKCKKHPSCWQNSAGIDWAGFSELNDRKGDEVDRDGRDDRDGVLSREGPGVFPDLLLSGGVDLDGRDGGCRNQMCR